MTTNMVKYVLFPIGLVLALIFWFGLAGPGLVSYGGTFGVLYFIFATIAGGICTAWVASRVYNFDPLNLFTKGK